MGRYFFKYTLATIIYKKRKIETNTIFTVAGRWKHVIKNQALSRIMVVFTSKNLEACRLHRQEDSFVYVYKITSERLSKTYLLPSANLAVIDTSTVIVWVQNFLSSIVRDIATN